MFKSLRKNKKVLRSVGIVLISGLVIMLWWNGLFSIIFYILGLYGAIYIISYLFKTTAVATFLITIGSIILYIVSSVVGLYLLYQILKIMFSGNVLLGLLLLFIGSLLGGLLSLIPMAIGFILGYPLMFMINDLEERFNKTVIINDN